MQQNRELLNERKNSKKPSFIQTDILRPHKGIAQQFKFKARKENAIDIESAINSMRDTLYNFIHNNRNNTIKKYLLELLNTFVNLKKYLMIEI